MTARFAIYAAPGTGTGAADPVGAALRERAEQWLGRAITGGHVLPAAPKGWTRADIDAITVDARRYGFHGTLKAPFRLAEGRTAAELDAAVARFAAGRPGAEVPRLTLARLGGFFALVPGAQAPELRALADDVVTGLDRFRAPATEAELARRNPDALTPRQRELLGAWGYPYVLDEFRFHMTVTDRIPEARRSAVERTLGGWFAPFAGVSLRIDALAVFTEPEPGAPFMLHAVHPLRPAEPAPSFPAVPSPSTASVTDSEGTP
jgi:putative phosphonate metabolism protein